MAVKSSGEGRVVFFRAVALLLLGLGGLVAGGAVPGWVLGEVGLPVAAVAGIGAGVAVMGILANGMAGMVIYAVGNAVMGAAWFEGGMPQWAVAMGVPCIMFGLMIRMFYQHD